MTLPPAAFRCTLFSAYLRKSQRKRFKFTMLYPCVHSTPHAAFPFEPPTLYYKYTTPAVPKDVIFNLIDLAINMAEPKFCVARTAEGQNSRTAEQQRVSQL